MLERITHEHVAATRENAVTERALVILSGGQDSCTCLALAKRFHKEVYAVSFKYGQRHEKELNYAKQWAEKYDVPLKIIDLGYLFYDSSSMLLENRWWEKDEKHVTSSGEELPATFVVGRNAVFLTCAYALAASLKAKHVYIGTNAVDYSGYPDCRLENIQSLWIALHGCTGENIRLATPLQRLNKADIFELAEDLKILHDIQVLTFTCYKGATIVNPWGYGCGECDACKLRMKGFEEYQSRLGQNWTTM